MSKVLKVVAIVAGVVAIAAAAAVTFGLAPAIGLSVATLSTIATIASVVATAASMGAQALAKPPKAQGSVNQVLIGANLPVSYCIGRSYSGGSLAYDVGYGGTKNSDRSLVMVHTVGGPIDQLQAFHADYVQMATAPGALSGYYSGFMWLDWRNGANPETALASPVGRPTIPEWGAAAKLSGMAAQMVTMKFDEKGEKFAAGVPQFGVVAKWVKVYDPRLDSTYPGGVGTQRWNDETTWTWSDNPGLHALVYCRGRFANSKRVVGVGLPQESIDIPAFVELANLCEANGWTVGGTVYEGPGLSKWDNLKRILAAGAAEPVWVGGQMTLRVSAPKVSLDEITIDDVMGGIEVTAMRSRRDRINTIIPRYRSEAHRWDYVQADAITQATYLAEDGEMRSEERQFDLVQNKDQAAELAAYVICNRREFTVTLTAGPRLIAYRPGEALILNIPEAGLVNQLAVITSRRIDPSSATVELTFDSETTGKHAFALGLTGVAPPTPTIVGPQDMDDAAFGNSLSGTLPALNGNTDFQIAADALGTITTPLPLTRQFTALQGTTDVSPTTNFALGGGFDVLGLSINNTPDSLTRGLVTVNLNQITASSTPSTGSGTATLTATFPNGQVRTVTLVFTKNRGVAGSSGGAGATSATISTLDSPLTASSAVISTEYIVRSDASSKIKVSVDLKYASGAGAGSTRTMRINAAYATTSGGALTDVFADTIPAVTAADDDFGQDGTIYLGLTQYTMPAPNTDYYFKVEGRRGAAGLECLPYDVNIRITQTT